MSSGLLAILYRLPTVATFFIVTAAMLVLFILPVGVILYFVMRPSTAAKTLPSSMGTSRAQPSWLSTLKDNNALLPPPATYNKSYINAHPQAVQRWSIAHNHTLTPLPMSIGTLNSRPTSQCSLISPVFSARPGSNGQATPLSMQGSYPVPVQSPSPPKTPVPWILYSLPLPTPSMPHLSSAMASIAAPLPSPCAHTPLGFYIPANMVLQSPPTAHARHAPSC